ncbi:MAG: hypothetical protein MK033_00910 [Candidatus Caenarcaniphilales bacterium]|nr:hypothetical protein [Candidatus Caenarcaniphilales bacterium]
MSGFSFREFLELKLCQTLPILKLEEILEAKYDKSITQIPRLIHYFKEYLEFGFYPIFTELKNQQIYSETLMNIIEKVIYEDISSFYSLKTKNLNSFKKILYFIASSSPGGFSINKLAKNLQKDHSTVSDYLEMMRETGLLRYLLNDSQGHSLIKRTEKIYFNNPNLVYAINNAIGKETDIGLIRELFVLSNLEDSGYKSFFSRDGDIKCQDYIFEIGGKSKTKKQIKNVSKSFLIKDNILTGTKDSIPIYLFGFLR